VLVADAHAPVDQEALNREVEAILESGAALFNLCVTKDSDVRLADLRRAWARITEEHRQVWRLLFGLDGSPRLSKGRVAIRLGYRASQAEGLKWRASVDLIDAYLYNGDLQELDWMARQVLRWQGIYRVEELMQDPNEVLSKFGWGKKRFRLLDTWLQNRGNPSLVPQLNEKNRRKFGIKPEEVTA
jgi:hypothetical protein